MIRLTYPANLFGDLKEAGATVSGLDYETELAFVAAGNAEFVEAAEPIPTETTVVEDPDAESATENPPAEPVMNGADVSRETEGSDAVAAETSAEAASQQFGRSSKPKGA